MRHNKKFNHLGRQSAHRKATLANMASSLIKYKRINTTTAKAKALRMYIEPLITKSKNDTTHSRRIVFSYLKDKDAVTELFREIAPKVADRPGGYTRILKTGFRLGDAAEMSFIELVDFDEHYGKHVAVSDKPKTRRSRAGAPKSTDLTEEAVLIGEDGVAVAPKKAPAKKAPAKSVVKPKSATTKVATPRTSGAKKAVSKSTTTKKG